MWRTGQIDPLLPSKIGPANGMEARESGFRLKAVALHEGRLFRNDGEAASQGLATKPETGRERIITLLSPSPITLDELTRAAKARRAVRWRCSNSNWQGGSNIWPTPSPCARASTKPESHGISIDRIVLVGFLLRTLGAVGANKHFAFHFRHPEKINQLVEAGRVRHGFEFGGHAGDVTGNVQRFPRHSPVRRFVASSRRSRWSAPSGSPISAFRFHETHLRGDPIKLSRVRSFTKRSAANPDCHC